MLTVPEQVRKRFIARRGQNKQRLDVQGLRMVAVVLVIIDHLFGWPPGGFVGVDVFFVISGYLITGQLLRKQLDSGRVSYVDFYRRRALRILPVSVLVLILTVLASYLILGSVRGRSVAEDAVWALLFGANWKFALDGTDYFQAAEAAVSPLQHYWSLSVEEQFYMVWPLLISVVGVLAFRRSLSSRVSQSLAFSIMAVVVAASFSYALYDSQSNPTLAYFSTFTRVWELGAGALLAFIIRRFDGVPDSMRPVIAWIGLILIFGGAYVTRSGFGFPAPGAALPVIGTVLVIAVGDRGGWKGLGLLTNRGSVYVGDISYSLYLFHWPVIILLGSLVDESVAFYLTCLALMFALSVASFHFFETPIRKSTILGPRAVRREARRKRRNFSSRTSYWSDKQYSGVASLVLLLIGVLSLSSIYPPPRAEAPTVVRTAPSADSAPMGPVVDSLQDEIASAVGQSSWPALDPPLESVIGGPQVEPYLLQCGGVDVPSSSSCSWGSEDAPRRLVVVGDSISLTYTEVLKNFAESSNGEWEVISQGMFGCTFIDVPTNNINQGIVDACPNRKDSAIELIRSLRPEVVVVANSYEEARPLDSTIPLTPNEWSDGVQRLVDRFSDSVEKVVFVSAPPADVVIGQCYTPRSTPAGCISRVSGQWLNISLAETRLAQSIGGVFLDSRQWFCVDGYCPAFVGTTPTKMDKVHMSPAYARKISPAFAESLLTSLSTE